MKSLIEIINPSRETDSPIEEILYKEFLKYGIKPDLQYQVGPFFIDMAFPEIKLAIEADGREYHTSPEQIKNDRYREERIKQDGWRFERFTGSDIYKNHKYIVARLLLKNLKERLTKDGEKMAIGALATKLAKKDKYLAVDMINCYLYGYVHK